MEKPSYSAVAALSMARIQKRLAEKYDDGDLALVGIKLERLAMEAIDAGKSFIHAPVEGRFCLAPALHRRVAHYLRLYAGQPGHDSIEEAERKATGHETCARTIESIARKNAGTKPLITGGAGDFGTASTRAKTLIPGAESIGDEAAGRQSRPDGGRHRVEEPSVGSNKGGQVGAVPLENPKPAVFQLRLPGF
jgi:hypothetical protein